MVRHKTHFGARWAEITRETAKPAIAVGHAGIQARGIENIQVGGGILAAQKTLQIRGKNAMRRGPSLADEIELVGADFGKVQAGANGEPRETGVMLDPADALLGYGKKPFAVADNAGRGIVHLRIVEAQTDHKLSTAPPASAGSAKNNSLQPMSDKKTVTL